MLGRRQNSVMIDRSQKKFIEVFERIFRAFVFEFELLEATAHGQVVLVDKPLDTIDTSLSRNIDTMFAKHRCHAQVLFCFPDQKSDLGCIGALVEIIAGYWLDDLPWPLSFHAAQRQAMLLIDIDQGASQSISLDLHRDFSADFAKYHAAANGCSKKKLVLGEY